MPVRPVRGDDVGEPRFGQERALRALFTVLPAGSHLRPALPLARALATRGWTVAFAASDRMRASVRREGFEFFPVGLPWMESEAERTFPELVDMPLDEQGLWWVTDIFADRAARPAATELVELLARWSPDIVVRDVWDFGAWAATEAVGIPAAVLGLAMHQPAADVSDLLGDQLAGLRAHLGTTPDPSLDSLYAGPYVDLLPASWQYELPPNRIPMGPVDVPADRTEPDPEWRAGLPYETTVLVTFGTVFNQVEGAFETVIAALADEAVNVLVTTGADRDPADLGPLPANTVAERYVPHDTVLPHVDAVVCHAGFGTTMAALAHDLPVVAIPLSADQPVHAQRCAELGAGLALPYDTATPEAITSSLRTVLEDTGMRTAAADLGREIRAMPNADSASDGLLAATKLT